MTEWKKFKLSEIGEVVGGATPSTKDSSNYDGNISWITPKDLASFTGRYIKKGERSITKKGFESCSTKMLPKNSILFSSRAPIGYVAIAANDLCTNQGFKSFIPGEKVDYLFMYYVLKHNKSYIESLGSGTTFKEVSGNVMKKIEVTIPIDISVQKKISSIFGSIDDKIELNNKINNNLQQQAFALFDKLLSGEHLEVCALSEIAELNPKRSLAKNEMARCIDMAQLSASGSFPNGWQIKPYNGGMRFANGDTLLARITPCLENGKTAYIDFLDTDEIAFGSSEYVVLCSKGQYPSEFFYCLARYPSFVDYAVKNMNGSSGRQRVSAETIGKYLLPRLTDDELAEFRDVVPALFSAIRLNSLENIRLSELRDALLPKLMSGEIDVSDIDI